MGSRHCGIIHFVHAGKVTQNTCTYLPRAGNIVSFRAASGGTRRLNKEPGFIDDNLLIIVIIALPFAILVIAGNFLSADLSLPPSLPPSLLPWFIRGLRVV